MSLPPSPGATRARHGGQSAPVDSRVSDISLDQASCPASLARAGAGADVKQGCLPRWVLEGHQHRPLLPISGRRHQGGSLSVQREDP